MIVNCYTDIESLPIGKTEWNSLLTYNETNTPFQTWEWNSAWWHVFGAIHEPIIYIAHDGRKLIGIAPFMVRKSTYGGKSEIWFNAGDKSDYSDVLCRDRKEEFINRVLDSIHSNFNDNYVLNLQNIPEKSSTIKIIKDYCARKDINTIETKTKCPTLILAKATDINKTAVPRSLRRHLNNFNKNGELSFKTLRTLEDAENHLDVLFEQHIKRREFVNDTSLFEQKINREFYKELVRHAIKTDWLFFSILKYDEATIATHLGFDYRGRVIWYKPSFDISLRKRSPGRIYIKYLIEYCQANQRDELDFTIGDEEFKEFYCTDKRTNINLKIYFAKRAYVKEMAWQFLRNVLNKIRHVIEYHHYPSR